MKEFYDENDVNNSMNDSDSIEFLPGLDDSNFSMPGIEPDQGQAQNTTPNYGDNQQYDPNQGYQDPNQMNPNMGYQDPNQMNPNMGYQDPNQMNPNMGYQDPNQMNPNMGYQDPNQMNPNMGYQDPNQMNPNMGYQDPNQMNPNMGYQDPNQMNPNMGYQDPNQMNPNMGYQDPNQMNPNMGYQDPNQYDANQGYQDANQYDANQGYQDNNSFEQTWMGALYQKAYSKKFNWCAAFFGPAYLLFRKMYLTGVLFVVIQIAILAIYGILSKMSIMASSIFYLVVELSIFLGLGFGFYPLYKGFISSKLNNFRKTITDDNQLNAIAQTKGGTSPIGLIIYFAIMGVAIPILAVAGLFGGLNINKQSGNEMPANSIVETESTEEKFNFLDDYCITYDSDKWFFDEDKKTLSGEDYTLEYKTSYKASDLNIDMTSMDGLNKLLTLLKDSFTNQATQSELQIETNDDNFKSKNGNYYAYLDIIDNSTASRYYFVVIPDDEIMVQFVLTAKDTTIEYDKNLEVIDMITNISKKSDEDDEDEDDNEDTSNKTNETSNEVEEDDDDEVDNRVSNSISNSNTTKSNSTAENTTKSNSTNKALNSIIVED